MKKFLLSLCIGFFGIISFCSAIENLSVNGGEFQIFHLSSSSYSTSYQFPSSYQFMLYNFVDGGGSNKIGGYCGTSSTHCEFLPTDIVNSFGVDDYTTLLNNYITLSGSCRSSCNFTVYKNMSVDILLYNPSGGSCPECPTCPEVNTGEILSGYILESEIDTNYCVGNGLCPNECGSGTDMSGDLQYSNFYINDILHPGTENIFLNIQDNIFWDYSQSESGLIVDVGSGYDQDYIDGVINVQSYRPTSEDFTQTFVGGLILFTPYVVILLFVILVRNLIKKIFKTK